MIRLGVMVWVLMGLTGCDQMAVTPVNISGQPIVGHWYHSESVEEGDDHFFQRLYLHVRDDGHVMYANLLCRQNLASGVRSHSKLMLDYFPIKRISVKKMVLQKYPLSPKFEIKLGLWPDQGQSVFEVDDLPLAPIDAVDAPDYALWNCE